LVALALVFSAGSAGAQSSPLRDAHAKVQGLFEQGRYEDALPHAQQAVRLSDQEFGANHPTTAALLYNLAELSHLLGGFAEAETAYRRALAIREVALGSKHPDVAKTLSALAVTYDAQGRILKAEPLHDRALAIMEDVLSRRPHVLVPLMQQAAIYRARRLNNLAMRHQREGRYVDAEWLYRSAREAMEVNAGRDYRGLAPILANLAGLLRETSRPDEAARLDSRVAEIAGD
jgi:tetratricopeptide (TPR) repeat protein